MISRRAAAWSALAGLFVLAATAFAGDAVEARASLDVPSSLRKQISGGELRGRDLYRGIVLRYQGPSSSVLTVVSARIENGRVTAMAKASPLDDINPEKASSLGKLKLQYPEGGSWLAADAVLPAGQRIPRPVFLPADALIKELTSGKDKINTVFDDLDFDIQEGVVYLLAVVPTREELSRGFATAPLFIPAMDGSSK